MECTRIIRIIQIQLQRVRIVQIQTTDYTDIHSESTERSSDMLRCRDADIQHKEIHTQTLIHIYTGTKYPDKATPPPTDWLTILCTSTSTSTHHRFVHNIMASRDKNNKHPLLQSSDRHRQTRQTDSHFPSLPPSHTPISRDSTPSKHSIKPIQTNPYKSASRLASRSVYTIRHDGR
jgi:hypothetical protein